MYCTKKITSDLIWLGGSDRRLALFENVYPIPRGVSYNAYLIQDEKTALLDTVDQAIAERFFENLEHALQGKPLNYVIVNHMEPDHAATLGTVLSRYPEATVIGNAKTLPMIKQFFPMEVEGRFQAVKEGDTLSLGRHELTFVMAPLVHWPEVMMTYDTTEKALFSADAFGTFGAMDGNIFADEVNFEQEWLDDARRYYTNIVGKYGTPVQNVLKKAAGLDIVVTKYIGMEAAALLAQEKEAQLLARFPRVMVEKAKGFEKYLSILPEAATAGKSGVSFMQAVREGGIFASLWELAERAGVGLHIDLMKIPMDQTVVEICNYYDLNPYEILSSGSALLFAKQGQQLCEELAAIGIPAAVIGQTTDGNDRIIQNGEEIRYLDLPKPDQIRKILNYTAKMANKGE